MKFLLLLLVVGVVLYLLVGRNRSRPAAGEAAAPKAADTPSPMLACAHCGVHLPREDALVDAAGRGFCSEAHRLAGPR